jgi:hypothetical protein
MFEKLFVGGMNRFDPGNGPEQERELELELELKLKLKRDD